MPLTPFHLGPGLLLGSLTLKFFNLWAILFGSVIMDIEPTVLLLINPCYSCPHHGFLHSILGAIFGSLILATVLYFFRQPLNKISLRFKIQQSFSFKVLFSSSLVAWLIHIFFDSLTHFDVFLFWPLKYQPTFLGREIYWPLNFLFIIFGIVAFIIFVRKLPTLKHESK
jgi:membrane-bound metal-dependent hydrolase YbcI (DUF457 family)